MTGRVYTIQVYPLDHLQPGVAVIVALLIVIQDHKQANVVFFSFGPDGLFLCVCVIRGKPGKQSTGHCRDIPIVLSF